MIVQGVNGSTVVLLEDFDSLRLLLNGLKAVNQVELALALTVPGALVATQGVLAQSIFVLENMFKEVDRARGEAANEALTTLATQSQSIN